MSTRAAKLADAPERLLLVEDDAGLARQLLWALAPWTVDHAATRAAALELVRRNGPYKAAIVDLGLPPDADGTSEGLATVAQLLEASPSTKVIVSSGNGTREAAVRSIGAGAYDFCAKGEDVALLKLIVGRALALHALEAENRALLAQQAAGFGGIVTAAPEMLAVVRMVERVAPADVSVLLLGESGTGKEVLARALHTASPRAKRPFVAINCAAIPEALLESELFGHEKGAFTGAIKQTPGKVEAADGGTLFLDEIGDMPLSLQSKLLRFLQDRRVERVGGRQSIPVDVRLVAATNQDLARAIAEQRFRGDLYWRLEEVRIDLPPLRARQGDSLMLAHHFLHRFNAAYKRDLLGFSPEAVAAIAAHDWPGNVREVENRLKRAVVMAAGRLIGPGDLDLKPAHEPERTLDLRGAGARLERQLVQEALLTTHGKMADAATLLGISRPHLYHLRKVLAV